MGTKMFVVMTNDYPAAVFSNQSEAARFCDEKNDDQRKNATHHAVRWAVYPFKVNDTDSANAFHTGWMANNRKREVAQQGA